MKQVNMHKGGKSKMISWPERGSVEPFIEQYSKIFILTFLYQTERNVEIRVEQ